MKIVILMQGFSSIFTRFKYSYTDKNVFTAIGISVIFVRQSFLNDKYSGSVCKQ